MIFKILTLGLLVGGVMWVVRGKPGLSFFHAILNRNGLPLNVAIDMWGKSISTNEGWRSLHEMTLLKGWEYELGAGMLRSKRLFEWDSDAGASKNNRASSDDNSFFYLYTVEHFESNPIASHVESLTRKQAREMAEEINAV